MVGHDTSGNALNDTTQTTSYPGADGTAAASLPDQAGVTTTTGPTGTATLTPSSTDPAYANKNAGDTTSRTVTSTGELVSRVKTTNGGALCLADPSASTTDGTAVVLWGCGTSGETWTIGTDGTVKTLGKCLDTTGGGTVNNTVVIITTCSGATSQQWKPTTAGALVQVSSGRCLGDPSTNQTPGGAKQVIYDCGHPTGQTYTPPGTGTSVPSGAKQTLTYDAEGRTATVATPSGTTTTTSSYLYDADGNLLEQTSSTGGTDKTRILYLFGGAEQITQNVAAKTWTALRNYTGPDGTIITRSSSGTVTYQVANAQGTATTAIDANTLAVTRRSYDPYGNPRGTTPASWVAPDENRGFLGQPTDTVTGLDLLGARNYDPATGRFLAPDPVFEAGDPNQMGGYTYAADNPASGSDPSGLRSECGQNGDSPCATTGGPSTGGTGTDNCNVTDTCDQVVADNNAVHDYQCGYVGCSTQAVTGYGPDTDTIVKQHQPLPSGPDIFDKFFSSTARTFGFGAGKNCVSGFSFSTLANCTDFLTNLYMLTMGHGESPRDTPFGEGPSSGEERGDLSPAGKGSAEAKAETSAGADTADAARNAKNQAEDALRDPVTVKETSPSEPSTGTHQTTRSGCSFSPDTPVLLADGKAKPIGAITIGDKVEAADPKSGEPEGSRGVQHVWINHDHDLLDVTVTTGPGHTAVLHTTANHPFWDATTHTWVPAGKLHPGHHLATTHGHQPIVQSIKLTPGTANRWNLTVQQLHTYYVVAGGVPILVHNSNGCVTAYKQARDLAATRANPDTSTVAVAKVRRISDPNVTDTWVATEQPGLPEEWRGEGSPTIDARYISGDGHAESTLIGALGDDWELESIASSTRMCEECFAEGTGLGLSPTNIGLGTGFSRTGNTRYRVLMRR
ncbi:polymorphic toxin-type HINT domain-containing protein [Streptomyces sp. HPF1205]|uniref:polymorphic toxin-type HINT domain-containing protein n=1 Tax=Streptomyces sp. HPF1205 TaxID=2873262 RepID=UPI001CECC8B5|nr:polymorphic toxin-type HINT domain-containing protein [Streptomyces sp. HPF1205]